jgi:NADPH-dependent glutamate synthase beta subunit-like oxidoreductase
MRTITSLALLLWAPLCRSIILDITNESPRGPDAQAAQSSSSHVAIIGAGAGGSSAAFWIAKAKERYGLDVVVDIFERNDYVGGRKRFNLCSSLQQFSFC